MSTHFPDNDHSNIYFSFMVRLWQEDAGAPFRASVQSVQSGKLIQFATIDALAEFLKQQRFGEPKDPPNARQ